MVYKYAYVHVYICACVCVYVYVCVRECVRALACATRLFVTQLQPRLRVRAHGG